MRKMIGDVGTAFVFAGAGSGVVVVQAADIGGLKVRVFLRGSLLFWGVGWLVWIGCVIYTL